MHVTMSLQTQDLSPKAGVFYSRGWSMLVGVRMLEPPHLNKLSPFTFPNERCRIWSDTHSCMIAKLFRSGLLENTRSSSQSCVLFWQRFPRGSHRISVRYNDTTDRPNSAYSTNYRRINNTFFLMKLIMDVTWARLPGRLHFARWHQIFVDTLNGTCLMSSFWLLESVDGFWIFGKFTEPWT